MATDEIVLANSQKCENKCTKTLLKVRTDSTDPDRLDIVTGNVSVANGRYVNLITRYYWESKTKCYVEVGWEVWGINSETGVLERVTSLSDDTAFDKPDKITLKINGTSMSLDSNSKLENTGHTMLNSDGTMIIPTSDGSISPSPNVVAEVVVSETTKYFPITFSYEYTDEDDAGDIYYTVIFGEQKRGDIVRLDNTIKILKPSRYDNNVIFNKEGLKEFIDNIKKYPVVDVDEVPESRWVDGNPSILVIHGAEPRFIQTSDTSLTSGKVYYTLNSSNQYTIVDTPNVSDIGDYYEPKDAKQVKVGSNVKIFATDANLNGTPSYITEISKVDNAYPAQKNGSFRINVNNKFYEVPIKGFTLTPYTGVSNSNDGVLINPLFTKSADGSDTIIQLGGADKNIGDSNYGNTDKFWRNDGKWSNVFIKNTDIEHRSTTPMSINLQVHQTDNNVTGGGYIAVYDDGDDSGYNTNMVIQSTGNVIVGGGESPGWVYKNAILNQTANANITTGKNLAKFKETGENLILTSDEAIYFLTNCTKPSATTENPEPEEAENRILSYIDKNGYFYGVRVYNAVFNDYAEYRTTIDLAPGHIVIDNDDGSLSCSSARLQPGAQVISDTFGHSMGETDTAKTPLAVAGRVLVYTYQPRENYHAGMAVCSAPDGTVDIMTREEIRDYPDCIIGIVSEIPQYETWGTDNVKVNGRIWIKVR